MAVLKITPQGVALLEEIVAEAAKDPAAAAELARCAEIWGKPPEWLIGIVARGASQQRG